MEPGTRETGPAIPKKRPYHIKGELENWGTPLNPSKGASPSALSIKEEGARHAVPLLNTHS